MELGFKRGDTLFLHMSKDHIRAGEIVVFNIDGRQNSCRPSRNRGTLGKLTSSQKYILIGALGLLVIHHLEGLSSQMGG